MKQQQPKTTRLTVNMGLPHEIISSETVLNPVGGTPLVVHRAVEKAVLPVRWEIPPDRRGPKRKPKAEAVAAEIAKLGDAFPGKQTKGWWVKKKLGTNGSTFDRALKMLGRRWVRVTRIKK